MSESHFHYCKKLSQHDITKLTDVSQLIDVSGYDKFARVPQEKSEIDISVSVSNRLHVTGPLNQMKEKIREKSVREKKNRHSRRIAAAVQKLESRRCNCSHYHGLQYDFVERTSTPSEQLSKEVYRQVRPTSAPSSRPDVKQFRNERKRSPSVATRLQPKREHKNTVKPLGSLTLEIPSFDIKNEKPLPGINKTKRKDNQSEKSRRKSHTDGRERRVSIVSIELENSDTEHHSDVSVPNTKGIQKVSRKSFRPIYMGNLHKLKQYQQLHSNRKKVYSHTDKSQGKRMKKQMEKDIKYCENKLVPDYEILDNYLDKHADRKRRNSEKLQKSYAERMDQFIQKKLQKKHNEHEMIQKKLQKRNEHEMKSSPSGVKTSIHLHPVIVISGGNGSQSSDTGSCVSNRSEQRSRSLGNIRESDQRRHSVRRRLSHTVPTLVKSSEVLPPFPSYPMSLKHKKINPLGGQKQFVDTNVLLTEYRHQLSRAKHSTKKNKNSSTMPGHIKEKVSVPNIVVSEYETDDAPVSFDLYNSSDVDTDSSDALNRKTSTYLNKDTFLRKASYSSDSSVEYVEQRSKGLYHQNNAARIKEIKAEERRKTFIEIARNMVLYGRLTEKVNRRKKSCAVPEIVLNDKVNKDNNSGSDADISDDGTEVVTGDVKERIKALNPSLFVPHPPNST